MLHASLSAIGSLKRRVRLLDFESTANGFFQGKKPYLKMMTLIMIKRSLWDRLPDKIIAISKVLIDIPNIALISGIN